jgi:cysteine desulfuration protein SufE
VADDQRVHQYSEALPEAPTTHGLAAILHTGLDGEPVTTVLGTPDDFCLQFGLADAVNPLWLGGAAVMLARIERAVRERTGCA